MARTPLSLGRLARTLRRLGHEPISAGYVAALESFPTVRDRVRAHLDQIGEPFACIGHSLGGLILRSALGEARHLPRHLIFLGTPQRSPLLARKYRHLWPYRIVNGEMGQLLADDGFFAGLPEVLAPRTIVAGTAGRTGKWSPFGDAPNDGIVSVGETMLGPGDRPVLVDAHHTFLMNHRDVRSVIARVLPGESY
ncbi:MAG TPA: hypothetical protein VN674_10500 [Gemmatimonadales bacterium]|nr:hypothetical protein [Gemmatimonadales bacterium]